MDEHQRQRLAIAIEARGTNMRRASLAPRRADGQPLFGETYVRDLIERGRGTKENLELICEANGLSFDYVWNDRGGPIAETMADADVADMTVNSGALRRAIEEALSLFGANPDEARVVARLVLTKIAKPRVPGPTRR